MNRRLFRTAAGLVGAGVMALSQTPLPAHALTGTSYTRPVYAGSVGSCGHIAIDPELTANSLTAFPSALPRQYAEMTGLSVAAGPATPKFGIPQVAISLTTCAAQPSWPVTATGDAGVQFQVCLDPPQSTSRVTGAPQLIGYGHRGGPIYDGPYPASQGYKFCALADFGVGGDSGGRTQYGTAWWDPTANYTFLDHASNQLDISAPVWAGNTVTMYLPYTWAWNIGLGLPNPPFDGSGKIMEEKVLQAGDNVTNVVATAGVSFDVGVPAQVAPNGICVTQLDTCIGGLLGLTANVDWLPGQEYCPGTIAGLPEPAVGCINDGMGFDLGLSPVELPGAQAVPTCANINQNVGAGGLWVNGSGTVTNPLLTCNVDAETWQYNPCQSTESWANPAIPGQGPGQDKGDLYMITSAAGLPCAAPSVTLASGGYNLYGRILGPNTGVANPVGGAPSTNQNHVLDQYESSPVSFTA